MKILGLITLMIFTFFLTASSSRAIISLVDTESTGFRVNEDNNVTQAQVSSGSGAQGDFEVLVCSTVSDGSNSFLDPAPGSWTTLDTGECGGNGKCILGIFSRFDKSTDSSVITCNWTEPTSAITALSLRYHGVDSNNPVLDIQCSEGNADEDLIIPSVNTEPGSAVLLAYTFGYAPNINKALQGVNNGIMSEPIFQGGVAAVGQELSEPQQVITAANSLLYRSGGPTGEFNLGHAGQDWSACAIALRAAPTTIPTLSEWGLGIFATLFGIAAVWALRRRAARA